MLEELDALWLNLVEPQIDGKVVSYLSSCHPDYKRLMKIQDELIRKYPVLVAIEVSDEKISLSREEHKAFREYMDNQTEMEVLEKSYSVYYAQAAVFSYQELLKELYREMNQNAECQEDE